MANRGDVVSVDKLWDIFDRERVRAWEGVDAPVGTPEWEAAAGKIDVINNICHAVHNMNTCSRADGEKAEKPVLKDGVSVVHSDSLTAQPKRKPRDGGNGCARCAGGLLVNGSYIPALAPTTSRKATFAPDAGRK